MSDRAHGRHAPVRWRAPDPATNSPAEKGNRLRGSPAASEHLRNASVAAPGAMHGEIPANPLPRAVRLEVLVASRQPEFAKWG